MKWFFAKLEIVVSSLVRQIRTFIGTHGSHVVLAYTGYGNGTQIHLMGRVVEEFHPYDFTKNSLRIYHFYQVAKLFLTFKVPNKKVYIKVHEEMFEVQTNSQGFFYKTVELNDSIKTDLDEERPRVYFSLKPFYQKPDRVWPGRFILPEQKTQLLVISDVDDTIIKSRATSFLQVAFRTLFFPVSKRKTFDEASAFYKDLQKGAYTGKPGLFFYVSSSTWNIYPVLFGFLEHNDFPAGALILNDTQTKTPVTDSTLKHRHKKARIEEIMSMYPKLEILLIGDAGQEDPQLYLSIAKKYKERVRAILIRESWWHSHFVVNDEFKKMADDIGVAFHYFQDLQELSESLN